MSLLFPNKRYQGFTNPFGLNQQVINTNDGTDAHEAARALSATSPDATTVYDSRSGAHRTYWQGADVTDNLFFRTLMKGWF